MIIGKGLIASVLEHFKDTKDVLIFASGVSNSSEVSESEFEREKELVLDASKYNIPIVYFSTCSLFDESLSSSAYVKHKLEMENLIRTHFSSYHILRLPTLIGRTGNPNTFFNSIAYKLVNNLPVKVYKNATRYLLDADDLKWIIPLVINQVNKKQILNIVLNNKLSVEYIINFMKKEFNSLSELITEHKGYDLIINNDEFELIFKNSSINADSLIPESILTKYISLYNLKNI